MARRFPDVIVATSHAVAKIYADITPSNKLKVIHAGIDKTDFTEIDSISARQILLTELGVMHSKIVIYASMLRRWKGPHILMQAVPQVVKSNPDTIFLFVGEAQFGKDDEFKSQLITLIQKLHLDEYVKLLGFRKDIYNLIAAADCLVHCPVESDPLPNVVLEAMALQTPVIGSSVGGIPEEIEDQVTGLIVEPCNHLKLAQAIVQILENSDRAKQLAVAGHHKLELEFSSQLFGQNFETVYSQLVTQV
jgi:spore coat protein SA